MNAFKSDMTIPRIIHQLWKDNAVPDRYRPFRQTWARLNPDWEMRLWTDRDILNLVEHHYPQLLSIYLGYADNICRADLGRYLILDHFGGVYIDLDCECLKPLDSLVASAPFSIGVEPDEHCATDQRIAEAGFSHLLCPSFIAAEAGHDFWKFLLDRIVEFCHLPNPLESTGPFLLTRAYNY